jgi:hypothetical protein
MKFMTIGHSEQLRLDTVERRVIPLLGMVGIRPMRTARRRPRVPIVTGARVVAAIIEDPLCN